MNPSITLVNTKLWNSERNGLIRFTILVKDHPRILYHSSALLYLPTWEETRNVSHEDEDKEGVQTEWETMRWGFRLEKLNENRVSAIKYRKDFSFKRKR